MEYYKTYCQEHSYEPITNFCTDRMSFLIQLNASSVSVLPASANTPKTILCEELPPPTKTSKTHTVAITIA